MRAEILSIGTELLLGDIVNTNAQYLSKRLAELGINVYFQTVVGDNPSRILEAYDQAFKRADLIVISGGLGPTEDDLTKEMAGVYFENEMIYHPDIWDPIARYYQSRGTDPVESAKKQALFPAGAEIMPNPAGTAPGCWICKDGRMMVMMPGPPREMIPMFEEQVVPRIQPYLEQTFQSRILRICGSGESNVEEALRDVIHKQTNPTIATYAKEGEVHVRVTARGKTVKEAAALLTPVIEVCYERLGDLIYGEGQENLEENVFYYLKKHKKTLTVAESLTGGLLTARLVNVPGISQYLLEGLVPYTNEAKVRQLGITMEFIDRYGPVSKEVVAEMAKAAASKSGADIGLGVTGWAGPSDDPKKPAGLIWMGISMEGTTITRKMVFSGDRTRVRFYAANITLCWLLKTLKERFE